MPKQTIKIVFIEPGTLVQRDWREVEATVEAKTIRTEYGDFNRETGEPVGREGVPLVWRLAQGEIARINQTVLPEGWEDVKPRVKVRETVVERVRVKESPPRVRVVERVRVRGD